MAPPVELCVDCFSVGAALKPHVSTHPYRVVAATAPPAFAADWGADEEARLLDGLLTYGPHHWAAVAEAVGTKPARKCEAHYDEAYLGGVGGLPNGDVLLPAAGGGVCASAAAAKSPAASPMCDSSPRSPSPAAWGGRVVAVCRLPSRRSGRLLLVAWWRVWLRGCCRYAQGAGQARGDARIPSG